MRRAVVIVVALFALAAASAAAYAGLEVEGPTSRAATVSAGPSRTPPPAPPAPEPPRETPFTRLPPLLVASVDNERQAELRLYDADGNVDERAARVLDAICADVRDADHPAISPIDRRTLKLMFRAAYHYGAPRIEIVSGYRQAGRRREGLHAQGRAVDFRLQGVEARELASYLRRVPRAGVGIYTHPRTQFVHLDVRDQSYHWIDASPPRKRWREQSLGRIAPAHDAAYRPENDWPASVLPVD